jgi:hypothetical protein
MENDMIKRLSFAAVALMTAGCATEPTVTKERMTLGEARIEGMECRRTTPIGTTFKRTICASPEAWARFDAERLAETGLLFDKARSLQNVDKFGRSQ